MPFTQTRWLRAAGMAGITGSRTALGPALAVRRSGRSGWPRASVYLMAALELIGDKLPRTPNRTAPIGLALRVVSGAGVARSMLDGRGGVAPRPPPRWAWARRRRSWAPSRACACGGR